MGFVELGGIATALTAGRSHTCAVLDGDRVRCWGQGSLGQLGYGETHTIGDDVSPAAARDVSLFE